MSTKRKLLCVSDSFGVFTGFANQMRRISTYLHETGKYDIAYVCWFYAPLNNIKAPFTIYTTVKDHGGCCRRPQCVMKLSPDKAPEYLRMDKGLLIPLVPGKPCFGGGHVEQDKYAYQSLHGVLLDWKPDIVLTLGDTWMTYHTQFMDVRKSYRWIEYCPIDGDPMPHVTEMGPMTINWVETLDRADMPVAFTDYGRDTMMKTAELYKTNLSKVRVIPHGCDIDNYHPLPKEEKIALKKKLFNLEPDIFLMGFFSRNQPRKAIHKIMEALRHGKEQGWWDGKTVKVYLHCPIRDVGWNLPDLIRWHKVEDIVILNEKLKVGAGPTDAQMNEFYNACDLTTNPSRGEGWGLGYSESMAAGVPVLMSEYSAHHDWAGHAAARIKTQSLDSEPLTNIRRAIVDYKDYAEKIKAFVDNISLEEFEAKFGKVTDYKDERK